MASLHERVPAASRGTTPSHPRIQGGGGRALPPGPLTLGSLRISQYACPPPPRSPCRRVHLSRSSQERSRREATRVRVAPPQRPDSAVAATTPVPDCCIAHTLSHLTQGHASEHSTEGRCAFSRKPRPPPPPPAWLPPVRQTVAWGPVASSRNARSPPPRALDLGACHRAPDPRVVVHSAKRLPTTSALTAMAAPEPAIRPRRCHHDPSRPPGCSPWLALAGSLRISRTNAHRPRRCHRDPSRPSGCSP
jgi:hypothetical protein